VYQSDDCPENISKILYNQIGALVFCNEELDKLFEYLNLCIDTSGLYRLC